jgi:hypothetical protein
VFFLSVSEIKLALHCVHIIIPVQISSCSASTSYCDPSRSLHGGWCFILSFFSMVGGMGGHLARHKLSILIIIFSIYGMLLFRAGVKGAYSLSGLLCLVIYSFKFPRKTQNYYFLSS